MKLTPKYMDIKQQPVLLVPKRVKVEVSYVRGWGEVGQDMWLIPIWTTKERERLAQALWGGKVF